MEIQTFTGGIFDTNCYFLSKSGILIDAPQESAAWLRQKGYCVSALLLTHGHIDHTWDAARIQREHGCKVGCHSETVPMLTEKDFFRRLGFNWEIEIVKPDFLLDEKSGVQLGEMIMDVLEVPGHCPGSLAFYEKTEGVVFSGDSLFAGSIGRTDLPGGDHFLLLERIREKLFTLPDPTKVLPGHGSATTIGIEKTTNPFLL